MAHSNIKTGMTARHDYLSRNSKSSLHVVFTESSFVAMTVISNVYQLGIHTDFILTRHVHLLGILQPYNILCLQIIDLGPRTYPEEKYECNCNNYSRECSNFGELGFLNLFNHHHFGSDYFGTCELVNMIVVSDSHGYP